MYLMHHPFMDNDSDSVMLTHLYSRDHFTLSNGTRPVKVVRLWNLLSDLRSFFK